jgi:broad specificity polyphosphatase/5'/3'-nucleotidase SurE
VSQLQRTWCYGGTLTSGRIALNVNYPPIPREQVKGVQVREQGQSNYFTIGYQQVAPGFYAPTFGARDPVGDIPTSDTQAFRKGYITVVPIDGDYTATLPMQFIVKARLKGLTP